jgi:flagellar biogenesis protein FliO
MPFGRIRSARATLAVDLAVAGRMLGACAVIALVLAGLQFAVRLAVHARARSGVRGGRLVSVLETTALPNASSLHVIRVADRYLVVGRSGTHIATLCDIPIASIETWRANMGHP